MQFCPWTPVGLLTCWSDKSRIRSSEIWATVLFMTSLCLSRHSRIPVSLFLPTGMKLYNKATKFLFYYLLLVVCGFTSCHPDTVLLSIPHFSPLSLTHICPLPLQSLPTKAKQNLKGKQNPNERSKTK